MTIRSSRTFSAQAGAFVQRLVDRLGVFSLLALGVTTAGATLLVGV
jgi:hypothetical protein